MTAPSGVSGRRPLRRLAWRDLAPGARGLRLLLLCLVLGVGTLAAIGSLTRAITDGLETRGTVILGGDIEFGLSQREASAAELAALQKLGTMSTTIRLRAMAQRDATPDRAADSALVELKAVDGAYPLYGVMRLTSGARSGGPDAGTVWIGPALADRLAVAVGDRLRFGVQTFRVGGVIADEPDRLGEGFNLAPVAMIALDDLPATRLIQPGSMFTPRYRIRLPAATSPDAASAAIQQATPDAGWVVKDRRNGAPNARRFIDRMGQFLTLVGLGALVIAGIGVGNGVASYLQAKRPVLATLKILGADNRDIRRIYGLQVAGVAGAGIVAALLLGVLAVPLVGWVAGGVLPVPPGLALYPLPVAVSALYGALIVAAFAWPPLAATRHVSAAGMLREAGLRAGDRPDRATMAVVAAALTGVAVLAIALSDYPRLAAMFIGAVAAMLALLAGLGRLMVMLARRAPRPRRPILRLALTSLYRPGSATGALIVAMGLGLTLFVTLASIQTSVTREIREAIPQQAPGLFVLDIPKDRADEFRALVTREANDAVINLIPSLRGRITAYGGVRVDALRDLPPDAWVLRGDRGLTYSAAVPQGSTVTAGQWWADDYIGPPLVSIDEEVATTLGVGVGDRVSINVLGTEIEATIAALRRIDWGNFRLNYVLVFSPNALASAPHNMVATVDLGGARAGGLARAIPQAFPSSSVIATGDVAAQIGQLLGQIAQAIAAASVMVILAGIAVLIGAIAASRERRTYDSVILKLLGATRRQILAAQALEYGLLALLLALVALAIGIAAGAAVVTGVFDQRFAPDLAVVGTALGAGIALTFGIGMLGTLSVLAARPAAAQRNL